MEFIANQYIIPLNFNAVVIQYSALCPSSLKIIGDMIVKKDGSTIDMSQSEGEIISGVHYKKAGLFFLITIEAMGMTILTDEGEIV